MGRPSKKGSKFRGKRSSRLYVRFAVFLLVLASPWAFLHFRHGRPSNSGGGAGDVKGQPSKQALLLQHSNTTWAEKGLTSHRTSEWITRTVRDTLSSIKGFHVNSDDQESEWNAGEISFHVASNNCDSVCQSAGKVCARDWFVFLDRCDIAKKVFPEGTCSFAFYPDMPFYDKTTKEIFVSKDTKLDPPTCDAAPLGGRSAERLCPCVPTSHARAAAEVKAEKNVLEIMKKIITEQNAQERLERSRGVTNGIELDVYGKQVSSSLLNDLQYGRVSFLKSKMGDTCEMTCKASSLKCSSRWFRYLNKCEVLLAAWPQKSNGEYFKNCGNQFYGHDLPGLQEEMQLLLLNNDINGFPTNCGGRGDRTSRICPCSYKYPNTKSTYHTVFNVQSKQYFEWQSRYNVFWHKQVGQPGKITRLLSMGGAWPTDGNPHPVGDHLMKEVPTHIAPQYDYRIDSYVAYNKPLSITHWLQTTEVKEDIIIIIDPDCAYINKMDIQVDEGAPVSTQGYYSFKDENSIEMQIAKHYCKGICKHYDPIAVPVVIHKNDLARLAPLWLTYTEAIRKDREGPNKWPIEWNDNRFTVNRIEWVAEMFGYVLAAAHLDLRHEIMDLQLVPSVHKKLTPGVPFLHFHVRIETADHQTWSKGVDHAGQKFPWPVAEGTDEVTTRLLHALHDAYEALGETKRMKENKWDNYFSEWANPSNEVERRRLLSLHSVSSSLPSNFTIL